MEIHGIVAMLWAEDDMEAEPIMHDATRQPPLSAVEPPRVRADPRITILLVEDNDDIRGALAEWLELEGYHVVTAADGKEGLDRLEEGIEPRAIVLDLMMPRMDGWTFLERLRADPRHSDLGVIVTSAVASPEPPEADSCLAKPFELGALRHALARIVSN
ncbi:MAG TPA: response regulator [Anaeromyxobacteraceae bacterium]|nr:response regulator [Anaeromyxobacteraceae bacterium]